MSFPVQVSDSSSVPFALSRSGFYFIFRPLSSSHSRSHPKAAAGNSSWDVWGALDGTYKLNFPGWQVLAFRLSGKYLDARQGLAEGVPCSQTIPIAAGGSSKRAGSRILAKPLPNRPRVLRVPHPRIPGRRARGLHGRLRLRTGSCRRFAISC